jgi:hypothetical protein
MSAILCAALFHKFGDKLANFFVSLSGHPRIDNRGHFFLRENDEAARQGNGLREHAPVDMGIQGA